MSFDSITNRGEFFSNHYLDAVISGDLGDLRRRWNEVESGQGPQTTARAGLRALPESFFTARAAATEAGRTTRADAVRDLNDRVLTALGFTVERHELELIRTTTDTLRLPAAAAVDTSTGLLLVAIDAGLATDVDDLVSESEDSAGLMLDPAWREADKAAVFHAVDAVGEIFATDEPPRYVLVCGGRVVLLAERAKWAEGRFLAVDLDAALERRDTKKAGELETIAALFSADALVPGHLDGVDGETGSVFEELTESSHKHAVGVSKELREGIRESIEILANEVIHQRMAANIGVYEGPNAIDPTALTRQCLRWIYRLLVLLYAESRPELGVVPTDDEAYLDGYSLDRLRELCLADLDTRSKNGSHLHHSLRLLFDLVNDGYHAEYAEQMLDLFADDASLDDDERRSTETYLQFPGLDAGIFDPEATPLLASVTLRNGPLQRVLTLLMLTPENAKKRRGTATDARGFISYAQLGINQLGAVYEGLMAYTGFFATEDLYEVAKPKNGSADPSDGTWMLPVERADDYPDDVFVTETDPITGLTERRRHTKGDFVFRLSGRDRQRSASYYTPEVLTRCGVKHTLAELLGLDDWAREPNGSANITEATQLLDLTICEPALGSGAFLNEAINQLAAEYLRQRQAELGDSLDPERYRHELQKVKAHYALHQSYGVDLNGTAVELAEVSLWLNAMHPGLKAPWFGLQLRRGNSLIGARRAYWTTDQLGDRPWAQTKKGSVNPPTDHGLAQGPLPDDAFHHFLVPGHGWAAVSGRKEAKELREDEVKALRDWNKTITKAPKKTDADRLTRLAQAVEHHWARATERIRLTQQGLHRDLDLYGADAPTSLTSISRTEAERILTDTDSPLGRLRTLMDAWVGLWFWPLDTGRTPPSWTDWLTTCEAILGVDGESPVSDGQLDLFDDLDALLEADDADTTTRPTITEQRTDHPWLAIAVDAARREGAWHWELEFAPVFQHGGFDLQVGNPPWVRPRWLEDLVLAENDPWWGVVERSSAAEQKQRRAAVLDGPAGQSDYLAELASAEGTVDMLGSPVLRPVLTGVQTNLYMVFMDTTWRNLRPTGVIGFVQPTSHLTDPKASSFRKKTYEHARRFWALTNALMLFEETSYWREYGLCIYGRAESLEFLLIAGLLHPETIDGSLAHDGSGEAPAVQYPQGGWDLRPHAARVLTITEDVLADWARLFDEPGTPPTEARLLRPITTADLEALSVLADQPTRLADHDYHWSSGWHEKGAKIDGIIRWETAIPDSWDEVILQGPHFTIATPFAKQPNENCRHNQDYSDWDLESLPERVIPRTNYQRATDRPTYDAALDHWDGRPATDYWRLGWRAMTQPGLERSLHSAILHPGPSHVGGLFALALPSRTQLVTCAALWASLPLDYLLKVSGVANVKEFVVQRFPMPTLGALGPSLALRVLRLNCLTAEYAPLWAELAAEQLDAWQADEWTDEGLSAPRRPELGEVTAEWTMATPLRRDYERRQALVELDALAALMLGLSAEQLCAMYRTQFAVLRKYEHRIVFDAEGRKICGYHQSAGYRQTELQDRAKEKGSALPPEYKNLWKLYEQWDRDPDSLPAEIWADHYTPPFYRPNREKEMTRAFEEFTRRRENADASADA